jgi:enterochelin esterase-like enzyme
MKKSSLYWLKFCIFFIILAGCGPSPVATLKEGCSESGEVLFDKVENTQRGYMYLFKIYLPPCYDADANPGYPVVYMIPGLGGRPGDWFGVGADQIADQLILSDQIPPFIIVATEGTISDPMGEIIAEDLVPFIENQYNAIPDRSFRAIAGGSLGGIGAYRLGFQHPDDFASVGMFGSGIIDGEDDQVKGWLSAMHDENRIRVFLNTGEEDPLMLEQAKVMASYLDDARVKYHLVVEPGDHSYAYWASNLDTFFLWVAEEWQ